MFCEYVLNSPGRVVYVTGEVGHPGAVQMQTGMTALQAITAAGGATDNAGISNVVLIRRDGCGTVHGERLDLSQAINLKNGEADQTDDEFNNYLVQLERMDDNESSMDQDSLVHSIMHDKLEN